jgi:hypothetical protein
MWSSVFASLESTNPANTALDQRFGFEGLGVTRVGHSPPMVPMLRSARLDFKG